MKKFLTYSVVVATIAWSMGISAVLPAAAAYYPTDGDLIKTASYPAVYYVSGGKKYLFVNRVTFGTWRADFSGLKVVSQADFDAINLGGNVTARPGVSLVKFDNSDNVYAVTPNAVLVKLADAAAKTALYGSAAPIVIQSSFEANYTKSATSLTATSLYPDGTLIKSGSATYLVLNGQLDMLTGDAYTANGLKAAYEHTVSNISGYSAGPAVTGKVAALSDIVAGAGSVIVTPVGGGVTVSLASNTPASTNLASGTAFNPVLTVNLTAGSQAAAVTGLKLKKSGYIGNTSITSIAAFDANNVRHGNAASSINSDNEVNLIFTSDPINVPAGQTVAVTIKINIASAATASTIQLGLASAASVTAGGSVSGSFPITGNLMNTVSSNNSIVSSTVATKAVNASGANLNIDSSSLQDIAKYNFAEIGGQEAMLIKGLTLYNMGNAASTDYADVTLVAPDGTVLGVAQPVGSYVTFSNLNYRIDKSNNRDITVRARIIGGTTRTIQLSVYNDYDVMIQGESSGAYIVPMAAAGSSGELAFPLGDLTNYNKVTIGSGTVTFGKDTSSPTGSVAPGTTNVVLGKFYVKASGEDMEIRTISLGITRSLASNLTGSVYVKVDGSSVFSDSASNISNSATKASSTLQSYPTIKAGVNSIITIEGNVNSNATSGEAFRVYFDVNNVKRLSTNDIVDAGVSADSGNSIAVQSGVLKVTTLSTPVAQTTVNGNDFEFANFELNANNSGEQVKVTSLVVSDTLGGAATLGEVSNLRIYQGSTLLETSNNTNTNAASSTFTFKNAIVVSANSPVVLRLVGNITNAVTNDSHKFNIGPVAGDVTAVGVSTGNTVTPSYAGAGQAITLATSGTATQSLVSGSGAAPSSDQTVNVGTTDGSYFAFKLTGTNEPIKIRTLVLKATSTATTALDINTIKNIRLYYKVGTGTIVSTPFATAGQMDSCAAGVCTLTLTATDNLLPVTAGVNSASNVTIYVKADIGAAGTAKLATNFRFYTSSISAVGSVSNSNAVVYGGATTTAVTYVTPFNVSVAGVSPTSPATVGLSGATIGVFKVTNNGTAPITLSNVKFTDGGSSSSTLAMYKLYSSVDGGSQSDVTVNASTTGNVHSVNFGAITTNALTINGGSWRYLTVKYSGTAANNDSFQLTANASAGDFTYSVTENDLGFDADGSGVVGDATISGLVISGNPTVETLTAKT